VAVVTKSVNINFLEHSEPLKACSGPDLPYYYYLLQLRCHSVAVVFTLLQTKQIRISVHKRNNTKTQYKQYKTQQIQLHILPKHPHHCQKTRTHAHTHILQNKLQKPQCKIQTKWKSQYNPVPSIQSSTQMIQKTVQKLVIMDCLLFYKPITSAHSLSYDGAPLTNRP